MFQKDEIISRIAEALLIDYTSVYYVNAVTDEYQWYSSIITYRQSCRHNAAF